jgi:hypothetical protein
MNDPKKPAAVPFEAGPVVSQAMTEPVDAAAAAVPTPANAPLPLSQVPAAGWSAVNLPRRS